MEFLFEFDLNKSALNKAKHGIDFVEAQQLWTDQRLVQVGARVCDEPRYLVVGMIGVKHWSAIVAFRGASIRIISVRRARPREVALYEGQ